MHLRNAVLALALTVVPAAAFAQSKPDFSGTWIFDAARTEKANLPAKPRPHTDALEIRQDASTLTIERMSERGVVRTVFTLDGTESSNISIPFRIRTTSKWEGGRLITEGTQAHIENRGHDTPTKYQEVRWLEPDGAMVVETTRILTGSTPTTVRVYYTRKQIE